MSGGNADENGSRCNGDAPLLPRPPADLRVRGQPRLGGRRENGDGGAGVGETLDGQGPKELFGRAVRFLRRLRRVRQVDLAARAGIALGRLSAIEAGKYNAWQRAARRLALALDFADPLELVERAYGQDLPAPEAALRAALAALPPPDAEDSDAEED